MNAQSLLDELRAMPDYANQIVYVKEMPPRPVRFSTQIPAGLEPILAQIGIQKLYAHQYEALEYIANGHDVLIATPTASGKSLCYFLPILDALRKSPNIRMLLLHPTKALSQDQFKKFTGLLTATGLQNRLAGVYDGDTPSSLRRKLRDQASVIFTNPDMLHAAILPQHARWAEFLKNLQFVVLDELHVYTGIFGSNAAWLLRRLCRICEHYGAKPQFIACSGTMANPAELSQRLIGRKVHVVDQDTSPAPGRTFVFWNPPRVRSSNWRSRRSANVDAHEIMAFLLEKGIPTITFSKAKITAEMIYRYVCDRLRTRAPHLVTRVTPYRGGYLPQERRKIEDRLFRGELIGVSTTPALELGIDVGELEACIVVGYPGTRVSFFQQAGRAGRRERGNIVFLVGLDTSVNQFIMSNPEHIFDHPIEHALIEPENPFVQTAQLRCAAYELPLTAEEITALGQNVETVIRVLEENQKLRCVDSKWYSATAETPHYEVSLRNFDDANVLIEDVDTGKVIGEVTRVDAEPLLHPEAIHLQFGETYRVLSLDLDQNIARVKREDVDYYTQPWGGTDIHHIDHRLRSKRFGTGMAHWGEVTAYFSTWAYEKVNFYSLDAVSVHGLKLPKMSLETMALWIVPPDELMEMVRNSGLDTHSGLRGIGYAARMLLPLFITCDTLDFSHTVGSANSPWNAVFIYERYPHGLGFTEKAFELLHLILPRTLEVIRSCQCDAGCPCCVGKPLRQTNVINVERGEGSIPSKAAAIMILSGLLGRGDHLEYPDETETTDSKESRQIRVENMLRRRLERGREPRLFHPIAPEPEVRTELPSAEDAPGLIQPDVTVRAKRRDSTERNLHKRISKRLSLGGLPPLISKPLPPNGMRTKHGSLPPTAFSGRPKSACRDVASSVSTSEATHQPDNNIAPSPPAGKPAPIQAGDPLANKVRRMKRGGSGVEKT